MSRPDALMNIVGSRSFVNALSCPRCGAEADPGALVKHCPCGGPYFARYDLRGLNHAVSRDVFKNRHSPLWRFFELLPIREPANAVTLGEGSTPILSLDTLASEFGLGSLFNGCT